MPGTLLKIIRDRRYSRRYRSVALVIEKIDIIDHRVGKGKRISFVDELQWLRRCLALPSWYDISVLQAL